MLLFFRIVDLWNSIEYQQQQQRQKENMYCVFTISMKHEFNANFIPPHNIILFIHLSYQLINILRISCHVYNVPLCYIIMFRRHSNTIEIHNTIYL